ncbi:alpha/beta fold hydrolase [Nocardioides sambongensis]|uniref:alpha/beta fold hydrolase n=1 Tax=Nocardioides sambongensis TaxID=2589074 RepID=UPI001127F2B7|nr:alpha/beta hydrolase [Nocardioides sambongensis]
MTDQTTSTPASSPALHVVDSGGPGRPVVLIHGWPLSHAAWSEQTEALHAAGYRVVSYDRRGFGDSATGDAYDYDALAADLDRVLTDLDLRDVTLVGFSMGGGEVARYVTNHGEQRLHSVVFAGAVPPYLLQTGDNPDGPLAPEAAHAMRTGLETDRDAFFDDFTRQFFSAGDRLAVTEEQRLDAVALCRRSDQDAALGCMDAFGTTDFRADLERITVPTLVLHGDSDAIVPFEGSGARTHAAIAHSEAVVVEGGPHGFNVSHPEEFNRALVSFLEH